MRWGLIPAWAKEEKQRYATFNAKAETVASAATFRGAWRAGRRCLVVTDGFYEWRRNDKQPFLITRSSGELTILAGLWETWRSPAGETIRSCTVLTTTPNDAMARLHDRMPVVLAREDWPKWLGETPANDAQVAALLGPCPSEAVTAGAGRPEGREREEQRCGAGRADRFGRLRRPIRPTNPTPPVNQGLDISSWPSS